MKPGNSVEVTYSPLASAILLTVQHGPYSVTVALDFGDAGAVVDDLAAARQEMRSALFPPLAKRGRPAPT